MDAQSQTQFTQVVLLLIAIAIGVALAAYLFKLWDVKQVQLSQDKWALFNWIVSQAVISTEQLWSTELIEKDERESHAVEIVQRELDAWGLRGIDVKRITDAVIAAVGKDLNNARLVAEKVPRPPLPDFPVGPQN